jgi:RNA polymerase sigma factor (sigma-70 family)
MSLTREPVDGPDRIQLALRQVAILCDQGARRGMYSRDAWQSAYVSVASRIHAGLDLDRPLAPYVQVVAQRKYLDEITAATRLRTLDEDHHQRYHAGEEISPVESAERSLDAGQLREALASLRRDGAVGDRDLLILWLRYVEERSSTEVAEIAGLTADNIRTICKRRLHRLRDALDTPT